MQRVYMTFDTIDAAVASVFGTSNTFLANIIIQHVFGRVGRDLYH